MYEYLPIIFFIVAFILILIGYPVAFTLGGVAVIVGVWMFDVDFFYLLSLRIFGTMQNFVLLGVPLFVFMGMMLEKSGIAEKLLETMALLFGRFKGGLALSVIVVGALLAASTGIVGATVVTMGLISLPTMLQTRLCTHPCHGNDRSFGYFGTNHPTLCSVGLAGKCVECFGRRFISCRHRAWFLPDWYVYDLCDHLCPATPKSGTGHAPRRNCSFSK